MTTKHRIIAISLVAILLLTGFAIGRFSSSTNTSAAEAQPALTTKATTPSETATSAQPTDDQFYLSDFKAGYNDGYNAALNGQTGLAGETTRPGYNEGYKQGYADGYQTQEPRQQSSTVAPSNSSSSANSERVVYRDRTVYAASAAPSRSNGNSKMKTALRIGAPAAIGAGVGAMFKGKKGAGIGALLGGGGGAIYELMQRNKRK